LRCSFTPACERSQLAKSHYGTRVRAVNPPSQTGDFYGRLLGLPYRYAIAENRVPSTGEHFPHINIFIEVSPETYLGFFELPHTCSGVKRTIREMGTPPGRLSFKVPGLRPGRRPRGVTLTQPTFNTGTCATRRYDMRMSLPDF